MVEQAKRLSMVLFILLTATAVPLSTPGRAAEFDLDGGRVVLRQLQYCTGCGSALLVTQVHPGSHIRCPDCGKEQTRIASQYVLNQMYQLCTLCGGPLNHEGHHPGDIAECDTCHTRQPLSRDVFALSRRDNGPGYAPGQPPGTGKKTLLLSPERDDARLTMIPLDDDSESLPLLPDIPDRPGDTGRPLLASAGSDGSRGMTGRHGGVSDAAGNPIASASREPTAGASADRDADGFDIVSETIIREQVLRRNAPPEWAEGDAAARQRGQLHLPDPPAEARADATAAEGTDARSGSPDLAALPGGRDRSGRPDRSRVGVQAPREPEGMAMPGGAAAAGKSGGETARSRTVPAMPPGGRQGVPGEPPPAPSSGRGTSGAMAGPAVTADLFGGRRAGGSDERYIATGPVVARVDGEPIYARDIDRVVEPIVERLRGQPGVDEAVLESRVADLRREVLERLIDREVAMREAAAIGFRPDPTAIREREQELAQILAGTGVDIRSEARRDVIMQEMRRRYAEKPVAANPQAVREFYQNNRDKLIQPRKVAIDQLVVYEDRSGRTDRRSAREIAMDIAAALESGQRFDALRKKHDEFWPAAGLEYEPPTLQFEAVYARQVLLSAGDLRRGAVFGPVFMNGMVLFGKITDDRPEGPVPFEEVEKEIRTRIEAEAVEKNLDAWLKRLRQKTTIEILL
ncbi:MAG: SurA N-terminal domain-containing protein [Planctomycetes bacterium]|nr:SurA N-terminal domain-containing protein [Planctomycetota bacterium]